MPKGLANAIVVLVSIVWAGNFAASFLVADYQPDGVIHFVFMSIVGGAMALKQRNGNGAPKPPEPPSPPEPK